MIYSLSVHALSMYYRLNRFALAEQLPLTFVNRVQVIDHYVKNVVKDHDIFLWWVKSKIIFDAMEICDLTFEEITLTEYGEQTNILLFKFNVSDPDKAILLRLHDFNNQAEVTEKFERAEIRKKINADL